MLCRCTGMEQIKSWVSSEIKVADTFHLITSPVKLNYNVNSGN